MKRPLAFPPKGKYLEKSPPFTVNFLAPLPFYKNLPFCITSWSCPPCVRQMAAGFMIHLIKPVRSSKFTCWIVLTTINQTIDLCSRSVPFIWRTLTNTLSHMVCVTTGVLHHSAKVVIKKSTWTNKCDSVLINPYLRKIGSGPDLAHGPPMLAPAPYSSLWWKRERRASHRKD